MINFKTTSGRVRHKHPRLLSKPKKHNYSRGPRLTDEQIQEIRDRLNIVPMKNKTSSGYSNSL